MNNSELITKLNSLKSVNPDQNWLKSNRELLTSQVANSGSTTLSAWKIVMINFQSVVKAVSSPAYALGVFVLVLIGGSLWSQHFLAGTKPNDSLYIARIISEKVKLGTILNSTERDKLAMKFSTENAQDITAVLSDPNFNTEANKNQVAQLQANFNQEVASMKSSINRLAPASAKINQTSSSEVAVAIAASVKDNKGVELFNKDNEASGTAQLSQADETLVNENIDATASDSENILSASAVSSTSVATSSDAGIVMASSTSESVDQILDEATALFNQKEYSQAAAKLKEVDAIIKQ